MKQRIAIEFHSVEEIDYLKRALNDMGYHIAGEPVKICGNGACGLGALYVKIS